MPGRLKTNNQTYILSRMPCVLLGKICKPKASLLYIFKSYEIMLVKVCPVLLLRGCSHNCWLGISVGDPVPPGATLLGSSVPVPGSALSSRLHSHGLTESVLFPLDPPASVS